MIANDAGLNQLTNFKEDKHKCLSIVVLSTRRSRASTLYSNKAFQEMEAQYPRVAMEVPSETRDESYAWLGAVPSMREWIGDREIKNLTAYGYTIRNKDFEATVSVPRNDLEDDCIGVYKPMFQDLAYSARKHPDKLVFGKTFTDHMFLMDYTHGQGWHDPRVVPYGPLPFELSCMVFHYAQEIFEGMKAYRTPRERCGCSAPMRTPAG